MKSLFMRLFFSVAIAISMMSHPPLVCAQTVYTDPNYANSVVSYSNLGTNSLYDDPNAALGQPTTQIYGAYDSPAAEYHISMVYAPYYKTQKSGGQNVIVTVASGTMVLSFDTPIVHSDAHWYGDDFILFGNTFFTATGSVTPTTDMTKLNIGSTGGIYLLSDEPLQMGWYFEC
jgi:hypothetical protein